MALTRSTFASHRLAPPRGWRGVVVAVCAALAAALAAFCAALTMLPAHAVFPALAAGLILSAVTMALLALASPHEAGSARIVCWDVAGLLTVIGLAAALFGEPEQAVALLSREER